MNTLARLLPAAELLRAHGYDDVAAELERRAREPVKLTRHEAIVHREVLVRRLSEHFRGTVNTRAAAIRSLASRYAVNWPGWASLDQPPEHHAGKPEALLFELHRLAVFGARWPLAHRSIVATLSLGPSVRTRTE